MLKRRKVSSLNSLKGNYPYLLLILANMIWGGNFVIGRVAADYFPPLTFSLLRWLLAFLVLSLFMRNRLKTEWKNLWNYKWILLLLSVTGIAGYNTIIYFSLHYTTSINAAVVNSTTPLFIAIFSVFVLKEKLNPYQGAGIIVSIIGVTFILSKGTLQSLQSFSFNKGDLFVLVAVIFWAIYSVVIKKYAAVLPTLPTLYITSFVGVLLLLPLSLLELNQSNQSVLFNSFSVFIILYVGILASIIAFLSWNTGVSKIGASKSGVFLNMLPVFATIFATVFTDENLFWYQIVGGLIVVSGVILSSKKSNRNYKEGKSSPSNYNSLNLH